MTLRGQVNDDLHHLSFTLLRKSDPQAESSVNWLLSPTTWKMCASGQLRCTPKLTRNRRSSAYLIKTLDPSITLNDGAQYGASP
jgi:hypothetical protein